MRDFQSGKVMKAESSWHREIGEQPMLSIIEIQSHVERMIAPHHPNLCIQVNDGRGRRSCSAWSDASKTYGTMVCPKWSRKFSQIVKLTAWLINTEQPSTGPAYCRILLALVRDHMSPFRAGRLAHYYQKEGVLVSEAQEKIWKRKHTRQEFKKNEQRHLIKQLLTPELFSEVDHDKMFKSLLDVKAKRLAELWVERPHYFQLLQFTYPDRWETLRKRAHKGITSFAGISTSSE